MAREEYNRKFSLEIYTFTPTAHVSGRKESNWVMTRDGVLKKQHLILSLWDLEYDGAESRSERTGTFYTKRVYEDLDIGIRMDEIARRFGGTHSRNTNGYYDDATFGILQRDELVDYLSRFPREIRSTMPGHFFEHNNS